MGAAVTSPELDLLRSDGQASIYRCAFRVPNVIYTALVNGVPTTHDMVAEINYDNGVGTLADVKVDMTMRVFSAIGNRLIGYARIRKAPTSSVFYIGEQSSIDWQDNAVIEISDDYDLWAKHIHVDGITPKMDYDVAFSDQHTAFNPVPMMGTHRVAKLTGASVTVQLGSETGRESWVIDSTITTYAWSIPSALSISNSAIARPTATFDTVGWHACYLTVTAATGKSKQGVRYVYVWNDDAPPPRVKLGELDEDYQEGGFGFPVEMATDAGTDLVQERALCIVFAEDYYGMGDDQTQVSIGPIAGAENIVAIGRIETESIEYTPLAGKVSFRIAGYQQFFKLMKGFPSGMRLAPTPTAWIDMPALTIDRALWHFLEWRCTATRIMDIQLTGNTLYAKELASPSTSLWAQMEEFSFATILAGIHVDCYGRFFAEVDPLLIPVADRTYPTIMTITAKDWSGSISLERATINRVGQINLSGVNVNSGGSGSAYFSLAPGHVFGRFGEIEIVDRLLVADQTDANKKAGLIFAARNNQYPRLQMKLTGNNRKIACFPNQCLSFTIAEDDTPRGISVTKTWIPRRRKLSYDGESGIVSIELELEAITDANAESIAINGDIPGSDSFEFPPLPPFPSLPSLGSILPGLPPPTSSVKYVLVHDPVLAGLVYTSTFDQDPPVWYQVNSGLTSDQYKAINQVVICPNGVIYVASLGASSTREIFIARAPAVGGTFVIIEDETTLAAKYPSSVTAVYAIGANKTKPESVAYVIGNASAESADAYYGENGTFTQKVNLPNTTNIGSISFGLDQWMLTYEGWSFGPRTFVRILSNDCGSIISSTNKFFYTRKFHNRLGYTGKTYHYADAGTIIVGTDNLTSEVSVGTDLEPPAFDGIAFDPTGQFMMTSYGGPRKGKSSDGGSSWSDLTGLAYVGGNWRFAYGGGVGLASRWVAVSSYLQYSEDFGITWVTKQGNMNSLSPLYVLDIVKVLGY